MVTPDKRDPNSSKLQLAELDVIAVVCYWISVIDACFKLWTRHL